MAGPKQIRGSVRPAKAETVVNDRVAAAMEIVGSKKPANIRDSIAVSRPEYWQNVGLLVAEGAEIASELVIRDLRALRLNPDQAPAKGLKDLTTIAAILIDKGHVIEQTLAALDPNRGRGVEDFEKRMALLLSAHAELQRRAAEAAPVDITPRDDADD